MTSNDQEFESAVARLSDVWMQISDLQLALNTSVNGPLKSNPHARRMDTVLKDLGSLIDESMDIADDLFTATRKKLAVVKSEQIQVEPTATICASCNQNQSAEAAASDPLGDGIGSTQRQLTVAHLDAYLAAMCERAPAPVASVGVQTPLAERDEELRGSSFPEHQRTSVKKTWSAMAMFDMMQQKPHEQQATSPSAAVNSSAKRQLSFSSSGSASEDDIEIHEPRASKKKQRMLRASDLSQSARPSDPSQKPLCISNCHGHTIQREYAFMYEGVSEEVWIAPRNATEEELKLIQKFKAETRRIKERGKVRVRKSVKLYNVEKIVAHRSNKHGKKLYYVKWDGYDASENTWEPAAKLRAEVPRVVEEYERERALQASRKAKAKKQAKLTPKLQSTTVIRKPQAQSSVEDEAADSAMNEMAVCDGGDAQKEEEDSEIERMAAIDKSDSGSDGDASE